MDFADSFYYLLSLIEQSYHLNDMFIFSTEYLKYSRLEVF